MSLNAEAARTDLNSRECAKLLGGLIGALSSMAPLPELREAVRWWAENEEAWKALELAQQHGFVLAPSAESYDFVMDPSAKG